MVSWRGKAADAPVTDFHPLSIHRAHPKAAWGVAEQQEQQDHQQASSSLLLKAAATKHGSPSAAATVRRYSPDAARSAPGPYGSRSQPASPARTRRISGDKSQQYAIGGTAAPAVGGSGGSFSAGSGSPNRNQLGFWSRTYGRPASNPSPSRPAVPSAAPPVAGTGRSATPGRAGGVAAHGVHAVNASPFPGSGAAGGGGSGAGPDMMQLTDLFTAQALKVPQRLAHSPYLSKSAVLQPSCPFSPKGSSSSSVSQQQSQQQFTTTGNGGLSAAAGAGSTGSAQQQQQQPASARAKLGYAFSFHRSAGNTGGSPSSGGGMASSNNSSKAGVSPGGLAAAAAGAAAADGLRGARTGPGALLLSPHSPMAHNSNAGGSNAAGSGSSMTARSSAFRSSRYTGSTSSTSSATASRQATPGGGSGLLLDAHKQSLHSHGNQPRQHQQQQHAAGLAGSGQLLMDPSQPMSRQLSQQSFQQSSQAPLCLSTSDQLSGLVMMAGASSSSIGGRPLTAKGSSRADLRLEPTAPTAADSAGAQGSRQAGVDHQQLQQQQQQELNLDPQSCSTFLQVTDPSPAGSSMSSSTTVAAAAGLGTQPGSGAVLQAQHQQQSQPQAAVISGRAYQSQLLVDLGLSSLLSMAAAPQAAVNSSSSPAAATPVRLSYSSSQAAAQAPPEAAASNSGSGEAHAAAATAVSPGHQRGGKPDVWTAAAAGAGTASHGSSFGRQHSSGGIDSTAGTDPASPVPGSPGAAAAAAAAAMAAPGPLHAGLLRPRSGNGMLISQAQLQQQQPSSPSTPQQSFLRSLQQQQQQQQATAAAASAGSGTGSVSSSVSSSQQQQPGIYSGASPGLRFLSASTGALRRKSATEGCGGVASSCSIRVSEDCSSTADSPVVMAQQQQQMRSSTCNSCSSSFSAAAEGGGHVRDSLLAAAAAATAAAAGGSNAGSPLRRPSDVGTPGSGSPLARLQGDMWGTLTAVRGSGFTAGFESSVELSVDCNSAGSWSSSGPGAAGSFSMQAAGGAAVGAGPGPSPLSMSSSTPPPALAAAAAAAGAAASGGSFSSGPGSSGARRALSFGDAATAAGGDAAVTRISSSSSSSHRSSSLNNSSQQSTGARSDGSTAAAASANTAVRLGQPQAQGQMPAQQQQQQQQQQQRQPESPAWPPAASAAHGPSPAAIAASVTGAATSAGRLAQHTYQAQAALASPAPAPAPAGAAARTATPVTTAQPASQVARHAAAEAISTPASSTASAQVQPQARQQAQTSTISDDFDAQPVGTGPVAPAADAAGTAAAGGGGGATTAAAATTGAAAAPSAPGSSAAAAAPSPSAADEAAEALLLPGYSVGRVVGEGGFCQVRLATHHLSRRKVAVKVIDKTKLTDQNEARRMQREIRVLKRLNHAAVIRLFEVLEVGQRLLLVMEYAPNGSLLDYVRARKRLSEAEAAFFLQQIVAGLQYCHDNEVVHRDIKLENLLLDSTNNMKLIDFGLAAFYASGKKLRVHCGSPSYAAPEIVSRKLYEGPPVDVWSLGVVLFAMLAGFLPFHSPTGNKQELCQKIMAGSYNAPDWLSPAARDLLAGMLTVDPERRASLADVARHPWTRGSGPQWELPAVNCYSLAPAAAGAGHGSAVAADPSILSELESHGYPQAVTLRYLAAGETNYVTASYYLLAEAKAEAARKLLPAKPWSFQPVVLHGGSRNGGTSSRAAAAGTGGSRPATSAAAATGTAGHGSSVRPSTAVAVA